MDEHAGAGTEFAQLALSRNIIRHRRSFQLWFGLKFNQKMPKKGQISTKQFSRIQTFWRSQSMESINGAHQGDQMVALQVREKSFVHESSAIDQSDSSHKTKKKKKKNTQERGERERPWFPWNLFDFGRIDDGSRRSSIRTRRFMEARRDREQKEEQLNPKLTHFSSRNTKHGEKRKIFSRKMSNFEGKCQLLSISPFLFSGIWSG